MYVDENFVFFQFDVRNFLMVVNWNSRYVEKFIEWFFFHMNYLCSFGVNPPCIQTETRALLISRGIYLLESLGLTPYT